VLPFVNLTAVAQNHPSRSVRLILGASPGGIIDILARLMGQWLSERLGQSFVIDNRPGGGGRDCIETGRQGGAGWLHASHGRGMSAANARCSKAHVNFRRDIAPIAGISARPLWRCWSVHRCSPELCWTSSLSQRQIPASST